MGKYNGPGRISTPHTWTQIARFTETPDTEDRYRWRCEDCPASWTASLPLVASDARTHAVNTGHVTILEALA